MVTPSQSERLRTKEKKRGEPFFLNPIVKSISEKNLVMGM